MVQLERIKKLAKNKLAQEFRCNHLAVIFKGNAIFSIGRNSQKTHPKVFDYDYPDFCKVHAELSACIKFGQEDCRRYSLAVLRIDRNGKFNQSKPCAGCQSVIRQLGFKRVFFTNDNGEWEQLCEH